MTLTEFIHHNRVYAMNYKQFSQCLCYTKWQEKWPRLTKRDKKRNTALLTIT